MRTSLFAGFRFFVRHRVSSLVTALALSVPLIVAVLGVVSDEATRPSPHLQAVANVGDGAGLILPLKSDPADSNRVSKSASKMMQATGPSEVHEVDLILRVDAVMGGRASAINVDQRDWTAPSFSGMLRRAEGRLPVAPSEAAVSSAFAKQYRVEIGQTVEVAGTRLSVVGIYDRPFALRAAILFLSRDSAVVVSDTDYSIVVKQFVVDRPLDVAELAALDPDDWIYRTGDQLITKRSALTKTPFGYAVVLFIGFLGLILGTWSLSARRRRLVAQTMLELGAGRRQMVGAACVEAGCAALFGTAIAAALLAIVAPWVHRRVADAAGIIDEPGWFPWVFSIAVVIVVSVSVIVAALTFQVNLLRVRETKLISGSETARDRSLEHRTRLAIPGRLRTIFGWVALTSTAVAVTGIIWATTDNGDAQADPGTRRPGDVEIVLPDGRVPDALVSSLEQRFPGARSVVRVAEFPARSSSAEQPLVSVIDPRDVEGVDAAAPLQVIETRDDWVLLTGRGPTDAEWAGLTAGRAALFAPEMAGLKVANLLEGESRVPKVKNVPVFPVAVDAVTLNRAKGAVSLSFLSKFGLHSLTQTLIVHTGRTDTDQLTDDVGNAMAELGISGSDIRIGSPRSPDTPIIVLIITFGGAILALEQAMFGCLTLVSDERRTLRLLTALGAGFVRRFRFVFGVAGSVATIGAVTGAVLGCVIGGVIAASFGGSSFVVVPLGPIVGLTVGLFVVAVLACAVASARAPAGSLGQR